MRALIFTKGRGSRRLQPHRACHTGFCVGLEARRDVIRPVETLPRRMFARKGDRAWRSVFTSLATGPWLRWPCETDQDVRGSGPSATLASFRRSSVPRKRRAERSAPRSGESQCRAYFTSRSRTMPPQPRRTVTPTSLRWHVWWKLYASPVTRFLRCSWTTDHPLTELGASAEPNYLFLYFPATGSIRCSYGVPGNMT